MADLTQTISNTLNIFAGGPSSKWNEHNWNAFVWGEGTVGMLTQAGKVIGNDLTLTGALSNFGIIKFIANGLTLTAVPEVINLSTGNGWLYVVPSNTTDFEDRTITDWAEVEVDSP
jgi:enolase